MTLLDNQYQSYMQGNVLITGGSGFLGRGIMRRAYKEGWNCGITVYSRDEMKQEQCRRLYPYARYILGDVKDVRRLEAAMAGHDSVIHAAAVKFVPEAEFNVQECIDVNVLGAQAVIEASVRAGVKKVVGISTDKAVEPVNVYGSTKFLMERLFSSTKERSNTSFHLVRYGNVIGSTGSVIPTFEHQIKEYGEVRLTDPRMTRFWITINQAIDLILLALHQGAAGTIIVPRPKAMKMQDLAECIAGEALIKIVGMRAGEKLDESLMSYQESVRATYKENYYELWPVGTGKGDHKAFTLASHTPDGWVTRDEMRAAIEDARRV